MLHPGSVSDITGRVVPSSTSARAQRRSASQLDRRGPVRLCIWNVSFWHTCDVSARAAILRLPDVPKEPGISVRDPKEP